MGSELDVRAVMRPWTEQMGLPVLDITGPDSSNKFTVTPKRFLDNPSADPGLPESDFE